MYTLSSHRCLRHGFRPAGPSSSSNSKYSNLQRVSADSQSLRFQHNFQPADTNLGKSLWLSKQAPSTNPGPEAFYIDDVPFGLPLNFWSKDPPGSKKVGNPHAPLFRIGSTSIPTGSALPGSEYVAVEMERNYSVEWPSISFTNGNIAVRPGFLAPIDDPGVIPFFFYRGLELVRFSWSDRALQIAAVTVYAITHLVLLNLLMQQNQALAVAVGLNWALGKLSIAKWGILLLLATSDKLWMYFTFLVAKLIDRGLARLFPPVRTFFWANFCVWMLYVLLSPTWCYPLPFWPFAPGSTGGAAAPIV